jgi:transposase
VRRHEDAGVDRELRKRKRKENAVVAVKPRRWLGRVGLTSEDGLRNGRPAPAWLRLCEGICDSGDVLRRRSATATDDLRPLLAPCAREVRVRLRVDPLIEAP